MAVLGCGAVFMLLLEAEKRLRRARALLQPS
jgi:hypothetical protein